MLQILQSRPDLMQVIGDLVFKSQDSPGAQEISERLRKLLPPPLQDQSAGPNPQQMKQQFEQVMQLVDQLTAHLHAAQDEVEDKKLDLASKERIALYNTRATIIGKLAEVHKELGMQSLEAELALVNARIGELNQEQPLTPDQPQGQAPNGQTPPQGGPPQTAGLNLGPAAPQSGPPLGPPQPGIGALPPSPPQGGVPNAT